MDKIRVKYQQLENALNALEEMSNRYTKTKIGADRLEYEAYRESVIQRFEYSYDLLWKYLKLFLSTYHDIKLNSPRSVFQECLKQDIISPDETVLLEKIVEDRNSTTHEYDEEIAEEISKSIMSYQSFFKELLKRIHPQSQ